MSKQVCFIVALALFGLTAGCNVALAQESPAAQAIIQKEAVTLQDLETKDPVLLPSSPFYFFKNFGRGVQRIFTFNPIKKAELELKFADEKIAETKKLAEISPERTDALERAIENYKSSQEELKRKFESLRETSQNPNVDKLLEKLADRTIKHEKLFAELKEKFEGKKNLQEKVDVLKEKAEDSLTEAVKKDTADKFARKLEKALIETRGGGLKHVRSLEILDRLHDKAPQELKEKLFEIRDDFSQRLKEDLGELIKEHEKTSPGLVRDALERLPGDKARRLVIIEEIQGGAEERVSKVLKDTEVRLEDLFQEEHEERKERAEEALAHAQKRVAELEEKLKERLEASEVAKNLFRTAKSHVEEALRMLAAKKYGEAFGQARSAEVMTRNALNALEEERPDGEKIKRRIAEVGAELDGWGKRIFEFPQEYQEKAKAVLGSAQEALRLASASLANDAPMEAKRHLEAAKEGLRWLERLAQKFQKPITGPHGGPVELPMIPAVQKPAVSETSMPVASRCDTIKQNIGELKRLLNTSQISKEDFDRKYEILSKERQACFEMQGFPVPRSVAEPSPTSIKPAEQIICTKELKPVCGNDGKTYSNACFAKKDGGVGVQYEGQCKEPATHISCTEEFNPVCGNDGKTYSNSCFAKVAGAEIKYRGECGKPLEGSTVKPAPATATVEPTPASALPPVKPESKTVEVDIINFAFSPKEIKISVGSIVNWTNRDSFGHTATSDNGVFDSGLLGQGASFRRTFNEKGVFPYHCSPHPSMQGKVIVE